MLTAASFIITPTWKHPNVHQQVTPFNGILFSNKRNYLVINSIAWTDLKNIKQKEARH